MPSPSRKKAAPRKKPPTKTPISSSEKPPRKKTKGKAGKKPAPARSKIKRAGYSQIVLLGTGTPGPDPDRSGPSLAIVVNDQPYLVDFGPGVVRRAAAAHRKGVRGLAVHGLTRAFLTHLHSDHTAGYPDLILSPWVVGRIEPLRVFGPPGLRHLTDHLLSAYEADIDQRLNGLEPASPTGYQVEATEIEPGRVYEDDNVEVEAFEVSHGTWRAYGYKFTCPDRVIVVSGDTGKHPNVIEAAKGCDVLIHEVCSGFGLVRRSPEWIRYHSTYHTLAHELAEIATEARPKLLVLTHQLFQGVAESDLLLEVRAGYDGAVVSGKDLDVF